jgi:hypothetical protein
MTQEKVFDGFAGRRFFGCDDRENFHEKWTKMTVEEKIAFIDEHEKQWDEKAKHSCFTVEKIDDFCAEWMKKTGNEKEQFVTEKQKRFAGHHGFAHSGFAGFHRQFH